MTDLKGVSYEEKLRDAGLTPLYIRRKRADLKEVYKVLNGLINVEESRWFVTVLRFVTVRATRQTTRIDEGREVRRVTLVVPRSRLEVGRNFFSTRAAQEWNNQWINT